MKTWLILPALSLALAGCGPALEPASKPLADPEATALWLASVFTVERGRVLVAGKNSEHYFDARLPFAAKTEIKLRRGESRSIIADQEGLYPLIIGPQENGYGFIMYQPFYVYLDEITGPDGLPGNVPNPKAGAMTNKGFRIIAEKLHAHFTKATGQLPVRYRVLDDIGYPSEHYIWTCGTRFIILTAYDGNDCDILRMKITSDPAEVDQIKKMPSTKIPVYPDWGDPLPSKEP